jgi:glycosyltransferase involved in cell wall biosynthesis
MVVTSAQQSILVSVITVVRNGAATISRTLESVREQQQVSVEHIIIDGASSDGTVEIIKTYQRDRLRWISERDQGIYDAMNKGVSLAQGEWILFLGADDALADPTVLLDIYHERELSRYNLVCGFSSFENGHVHMPKLDWRTQVFNTVHHQAAFYRRSVFRDFRYRTDIPVIADYELNYLLYLQRHPVLFIDRKVSICGNLGISHTSSKFGAQLDAYRIRSRYTNSINNTGLLALGLLDLVLAQFVKGSHKSGSRLP